MCSWKVIYIAPLGLQSTLNKLKIVDLSKINVLNNWSLIKENGGIYQPEWVVFWKLYIKINIGFL